MPVPTAPTTAVAGQPAKATLQFNALAAQVAWLLSPPLAVLRQSVAQAALVTATYTDVLMDAEDLDDGGAGAAGGHSTVTNTARYTAQTAGWYEVEGIVSFGASATGIRIVRLAVNGTTFYRLFDGPPTASGGTDYGGTQTLYLAVGDYVTLQARQDSGANLSLNITSEATSRMTVRFVHQ